VIRDALIEGMEHSSSLFLLLLEGGDERPLSAQDVDRERSMGRPEMPNIIIDDEDPL
jgi:hypothetical protein